ncbi:hypothetical protein [Cytobacillus purgationiresistens]|uniref:DUF4129 domain-containing protein n=1 Tax=Cytobacillus purgationiresistens TaxID=863449 RepID=A0ABU0AIF6_9BACI|nr:hypothetical protein [Cytobacillus purgationiresistens]MDQ0270679.1 hypothetical protein [Cytobacillus purgationiresistens]
MKKAWTMFYLIFIEVIFGGLVILPFYPQILAEYFIISISAAILIIMLLLKYHDKGKAMYLSAVLPIIIVYVYFSHLSFAFLMLIAVLIFWRGLVHFKEFQSNSAGAMLLITLIAGVGLLIFPYVKTEMDIQRIVLFMIVQSMFILIGSFFIRWLNVRADHIEKKRYALYFFTTIGAIIGTGLLIAGSVNLLKWLFFKVLQMGVWLISTVISPAFDIFENLDLTPELLAPVPEVVDEEETLEEYVKSLNQETLLDPAILFSIITIVALLLFSIYLYRRHNEGKIDLIANEQTYQMSTLHPIFDESAFLNRKKYVPEHKVRKEVYHFERLAEKLKLGRKPQETFPEWMNRIGLQNNNHINEIYEKVRYGSLKAEISEEAIFFNGMKELKGEMKVLHKRQKKEEKEWKKDREKDRN